jgi:redox-regulated HSP33 family molecular chaperone
MPAGNGTYVVSRQAGAFPSGREPLLAEALIEANLTCYNLKKQMKLTLTTENPGPYILGNYPKATVIFSCE